jgi:hypothetical protein
MKATIVLSGTEPRRIVLDHSKQDRTPLFDWRLQLAAADQIIAYVGSQRTQPAAMSYDGTKIVNGLDLRDRRESLARMLADAAEAYETEKDDFTTRAADNNPKKHWEANIDLSNPTASYDYGEYADAGFDERGNWEKFWQETYGRARGNPGTSRAGGPPLANVRGVYHIARGWWRAQRLGSFDPWYGYAPGQGATYDVNDFNPAARLLLSVLRYLDPGYLPENARSLHDHLKRKKPRAQQRRKKQRG